MPFTNTKEDGLEALIVKWFIEQNGYEQGQNADYNKEYAIDETRLFRFLQDTQPKQLEILGTLKSDQKKRHFLKPEAAKSSVPVAVQMKKSSSVQSEARTTASIHWPSPMLPDMGMKYLK